MSVLYQHPDDPPPAAEFIVRRTAAGGAELTGRHGWLDAQAVSWGPDEYRTTFKAVWNDAALFVRFECRDRNPWWTIAVRDGRLWNEEVVEIFLDPLRRGANYAEVEISPANIVCDLMVRTPWPNLLSDPTWDWSGLESHVVTALAGEGVVWTATAKLPFEGLRSLADGVSGLVPPKPGDRWRFNVFRIKRPGGPHDPEGGVIYAAWSVPSGPSFHDPACFRDLVFSGG
jgi:hypothetical protein